MFLIDPSSQSHNPHSDVLPIIRNYIFIELCICHWIIMATIHYLASGVNVYSSPKCRDPTAIHWTELWSTKLHSIHLWSTQLCWIQFVLTQLQCKPNPPLWQISGRLQVNWMVNWTVWRECFPHDWWKPQYNLSSWTGYILHHLSVMCLSFFPNDYSRFVLNLKRNDRVNSNSDSKRLPQLGQALLCSTPFQSWQDNSRHLWSSLLVHSFATTTATAPCLSIYCAFSVSPHEMISAFTPRSPAQSPPLGQNVEMTS